jgi:hypothetical protein
MNLHKIYPLLECNICYEKRILINCKNNLCNWKMCKYCLIKYNKTKCPACRNEKSFKIINDICSYSKKKIYYFFNYLIDIIKSYINGLILIYSYIFNFLKYIFKEKPKRQNIIYFIIVFSSLLVFGLSISNMLFFNNKKIEWLYYEIIIYSFLGIIFIFLMIFLIIILFICIHPLYMN